MHFSILIEWRPQMTARSLIISSDVIRLPNRLKTQRKVIQFSEIEKPKRKNKRVQLGYAKKKERVHK